MKLKTLLVIVVLLGTCLTAPISYSPSKMSVARGQSTEQTGSARYDLGQVYGLTPLSFEVITGAHDGEAEVIARSRGFNLFLMGNDAIVAVRKADGKSTKVLQMRALGSNPHPKTSGIGRLEARSNYLIGNDPGEWRVGIPNFERVLLQNIYPGIDLTYYGRQGDLEYDFVVAPGSDPRRIRLEFVGAQQLRLDDGNLFLHMGDGELRLHQPFVYQIREGKRVPVPGKFAAAGHNAVRFAIGDYDPRHALVIDPGLVYSSYLGGSGRDEVLGMAVGGDGSTYVTGSTTSVDFPTSAQGSHKVIDHSAVFITKLNPTGAIEYSTYLGGSQRNIGTAIAVNDSGEAYVAGSTYSIDFPITRGTLQPHNAGGLDAFISKLSADGSHLLYSTYLGGSGEDEARGLALDANGNAFIAGFTRSSDFPTDRIISRADCGAESCRQAFVARVNAMATATDYATTIGGTGDTSASGIGLDLSGAAYITGNTDASDLPTSVGAFQTYAADHSACLASGRQCSDVFVAKLSSQGAVLYASYVSGRGDQHGNAITVDDRGSAYVTGSTDSENFPTTSDVLPGLAPSHTTNTFVFKMNPLGSKLDYSTLLGGHQQDEGKAIAVDVDRHVYVAGWTSSPLFPVTADALQTRLLGKSAGFITRLDERGAKLEYSSLIGGNGSDVATAVALDREGNIYVAGSTDSIDFPLRKAVQGSLLGERNAFVAKFSSESAINEEVNASAVAAAAPVVTLSATSLQFINQKPGTRSTSQTVKLTNSGNASLTNIAVTVVGTNSAEFTVTTNPSPNCGGSLPANASCVLSVTFKPVSTGVRVATIQIADNAANSPQTVALTGNPPIASVSTASLTFASQPEGSLSPYQTVTLKNTAAYSSLAVSGISISGNNFQQASNCPGTLVAKASCNVTVAFMPGATGTLTANLDFADNSLNNSASKQTVAMSGTATSAPVASLSAASINFGTLQQGTKSGIKSITLTNTGVGTLTISNVYITAADSFILSTGSGTCSATPSLNAGASCLISVTFYANPGIQTSSVLVTDNSGNLSGTVQEISLVGAGTTGTYNGQFSTQSMDFGSVQMGSTGVQKIVQFTNTGTLPLSFGANSLFTNDHYDYQVQPASSNGCGAITLAVGASCNILIVFNPALGSPGLRTATASITVAAPFFTQATNLIGIATGQAIPTLSTTGLIFGTVKVGSTSAAKTVVLKDTGNEPLTVEGLNVSGAGFAVVPAPPNNCSSTGGTTLVPGASCNISIVFQPQSTGTLGGLLTLFSVTGNGLGTQLDVALTGTGQSTTPGPIVTMSTNTLHFGNQQAGTVSAAQAITLANTGTIPWYISSVSSGSYVMESACNNYVNPGDSCVVNVYFAPTTLGPQLLAAALQLLTSTASDNLMLAFTGTGIGNLAASASTAKLDLGSATSGSVGSSGTVTFTNTGNVPYPVGGVGINELNLVGIGAPLDFEQTNNCQFGPSGMMPVGASCTVVVTFTPAIGPAGPREALLTFQEASPGTSLLQQNVTVTGTATGTPVLSVSPLAHTFLDQTEGTSSSALALGISNTGTAPLPINYSLGSGEFPLISYDCPSVLDQGASCVAYFAFYPNTSPSFGPRLSSVVVFAQGGFLNQQLVQFSGFGTPHH